MSDERDICERLEDARYDGSFAMRRDAARLIRQLRYYTTRLEADLVAADLETESLRKHVSKQQLDIATLGQEVGRLRKALGKIATLHWYDVPANIARAALGEEKKGWTTK
jgi:predicted  nucleic acid-binding Zn-ribbon protein